MQSLNLFILCLFYLSCADGHNIETDNEGNLSKSDYVEQFVLSSKLNEVSGLCLTDDQRLFAHNDEKGAIYQIDYSNGKIVKSFFLGKILTVNQDFEGIAFANDLFYMITSSGLLYVFPEGNDKEVVKYSTIDLKMNSKFEVEGLCYDPSTKSLLIACKEYAGKNYKGNRSVFSMLLGDNKLKKKPRFIISLKELDKKFRIKDFYPSAIEISLDGKTFYILSSKGATCLVEISSNGELVNAAKLDKNKHRQPEGLTQLKDGTMIIADEASGKRATLSLYSKNPLIRK